MHGEMLTYGLKRGTKNELLHIDDANVHNGLACDCLCPHCHHPLLAKNGGSKNTHHFAHARQGMILCVPEGSKDDPTRLPEFYNNTYEYLKSLGIEDI